MIRLPVIWTLCLLIAAGAAHGQSRGLAEFDDEVKLGKYYALIFAADVYEQWPDLINPINDARTLGDELQTSYGFEVELVENPSQEMILSKVRDYAERTYEDNDHLLIFYAGHGKYDEIDGEGYIVSADSRLDDETNLSYIPYSQLRTRVNNIPNKHLLMVLDACFGGTFDTRVRGNDPYAGGTRSDFLARKLRFQTRRYITSGGKEYVPDGRPGQHSPFMRRMLEALRSYGGRDGILTLGEVQTALDYVEPLPITGEFGDNEPGSDFLFIARSSEDPSEPAVPLTVAEETNEEAEDAPEQTDPETEAERATEEPASDGEAASEAPPEENLEQEAPETETAAEAVDPSAAPQEAAEQADPVRDAPEAQEDAGATEPDEAVPPADPGVVTEENGDAQSPEATTEEAVEQADPDVEAEDETAQEAANVEAQDEAPPAEASRPESAVEKLLREAESSFETGLAQSDTSAEAEGAFREASALLTQIKQLLDEQVGDDSTAADPVVDSIYVATTGTFSDHVRVSMEYARDKVPPQRRQSPLYQEATSIEARALQFHGARLYIKAASLFDEARAKYQEAAAAEVAEAEVPPALEGAINGFAETLKITLETEDAGTMGALFYRNRDWRAFFETASDITAVIRPGPVQMADNSATVLVEADLSYQTADGQPQQETLKHLWTLKKMGDDWMPIKVVLQQ